MPGPVIFAGAGAKAVGDDPDSAIPRRPDRQAEVERLRERSPKRWMASATATRTERAVIEQGIGPGGFCSRQRWAGGTAGWVERGSVRSSVLDEDGLEGGGVRVSGANCDALSDWTTIREGALVRSAGCGPTMPVAEWQAVEGRRSQRWRGAERSSHGGGKAVSCCRHRQAKRDGARRDGGDGCAGAKRHTGHNRKKGLPSAMPRAAPVGRSGKACAAYQAASPKTTSGRLVQTAERSSPVAR